MTARRGPCDGPRILRSARKDESLADEEAAAEATPSP